MEDDPKAHLVEMADNLLSARVDADGKVLDKQLCKANALGEAYEKGSQDELQRRCFISAPGPQRSCNQRVALTRAGWACDHLSPSAIYDVLLGQRKLRNVAPNVAQTEQA